MTEAVESVIAIDKHESLKLSVQQLMDCSSDRKVTKFIGLPNLNYQCDGGYVYSAMYYTTHLPLPRESLIPYLGYEDKCYNPIWEHDN